MVSSLRQIEASPDLTQQVYERLLEAICSADLAPGARLTQQDLAASFNVSRQPVLQALRMLRKDGFVIDAGRRGLMVAPLDAQVIEQTYQVRAALDALAAREAALRKAILPEVLIRQGRAAALRQRHSTQSVPGGFGCACSLHRYCCSVWALAGEP